MLISASQERRLRLPERVSLKLHTMRCSGCRNFSFQLPFIRQVMRAYAAGQDAEARK